jgi:hypothetical protein
MMPEDLSEKLSNRQILVHSAVCALVLVLFFVPGPYASVSEILIDDYKTGLSGRWKEKSFKGNTRYQVVKDGASFCIKAHSSGTASALYYSINYDTKAYPIIAWSWKVDHVLKNGDARRMDGDDYAARLYVVFPSVLPWKTRAINYIWANKLPVGYAVPNPFTKNSIMLAVQSGSIRTGQWIEEKRNVFEDYRLHFGEDPPKAGAIAIMTDTDNTGEDAIAYYGPIRILTLKLCEQTGEDIINLT